MTEIKDRHGKVVQLDSDLNGVDFDSASLDYVDFSSRQMEGANFSDASLAFANLESCDLYWAIFFRANLVNANLRLACLCGADLKYANLSNADLREADFGLDHMGGATQLQGVNLTNCLVSGANFGGAIYDRNTLFPAGFDPVSHGMILVDSRHER